jgi:endonuclease/exonuclease/phosphatase family metal-dependent hydrolase
LSYRNTSPRPRALALVGLVAGVATLLLAPTAASAGTPNGEVKVMTRNVYLGASLTPALEAEDTGQLAQAAFTIYSNVKYTDFPQRAKLLAKEIKKAKPDLVGLQEVAQYREDTIDEGIPCGPSCSNLNDGPFTPATTITIDFLKSLNKELEKAGADYRVVDVQREADLEIPSTEGDRRLIMRDVILARNGAGVKTQDGNDGHFENLLEVTVGGAITVEVDRGWLYTEANVRGTKFRFLNTHLEAFGDEDQPAGELRESQAEELIASFPPAGRPGPATYQSAGGPVVAVGDFNSDDDTVFGDDTLAYAALTSGPNSLTERSTLGGVENSCCFEDELIEEDPPGALDDLDHHIDKVFVNNLAITEVDSEVVGNVKRITSTVVSPHDLWASDHMGVITTLQFPTP